MKKTFVQFFAVTFFCLCLVFIPVTGQDEQGNKVPPKKNNPTVKIPPKNVKPPEDDRRDNNDKSNRRNNNRERPQDTLQMLTELVESVLDKD